MKVCFVRRSGWAFLQIYFGAGIIRPISRQRECWSIVLCCCVCESVLGFLLTVLSYTQAGHFTTELPTKNWTSNLHKTVIRSTKPLLAYRWCYHTYFLLSVSLSVNFFKNTRKKFCGV